MENRTGRRSTGHGNRGRPRRARPASRSASTSVARSSRRGQAADRRHDCRNGGRRQRRRARSAAGVPPAAGTMVIPEGQNANIRTMRLKGEVIGEWVNSVIVPGLTFGWSPAGPEPDCVLRQERRPRHHGRAGTKAEDRYGEDHEPPCLVGRREEAGVPRAEGPQEIRPERSRHSVMPNAEGPMPKGIALALAVASAVAFGLRPSAFGIHNRSPSTDLNRRPRRGRRDRHRPQRPIRPRLAARRDRDPRGRQAAAAAGAVSRRARHCDAGIGRRRRRSSTPATASTPVRRAFFFLFDQEHLTPGSLEPRHARASSSSSRVGFPRRPGSGGAVRDRGEWPGADDGVARGAAPPSVRDEAAQCARRPRLADIREWPRILSDVEASRIDQGDTTVSSKRRSCARARRSQARNCAEQAELAAPAKSRGGSMRDADAAAESHASGAVDRARRAWRRLEGPEDSRVPHRGVLRRFAPGRSCGTVTGDAGRAGVAIYVIDARGLDKTGRPHDSGGAPPNGDGLRCRARSTRARIRAISSRTARAGSSSAT